MIDSVLQLARGTIAAVRAPRWTVGDRLKRLVGPADANAPDAHEPELAVRSARLTLRVLAWLPWAPWRNTCLFRSIAECLVLRRYGVSCRLEIGVRRAKEPGGGVQAHAWVVRDGTASDEMLVSLAALR